MIEYFLNADFSRIGGLRYVFAENFAPYQFFTHMFLHGGGWHLFTNMFGLFMFGSLLERFWGAQKFLIFYMVCGLGASVLYSGVRYFEVRPVQEQAMQYAQNPDPERFNLFILEYEQNARLRVDRDFIDQYYDNPDNPSLVQISINTVQRIYDRIADVPVVGASGAIFGILMAFGMLFPNTQLMLLFPPIPIKAKYFVTFYGLYELYAGVARVPGDNIAHFAHLGGMLFAFILLKIWQNQRSNFY